MTNHQDLKELLEKATKPKGTVDDWAKAVDGCVAALPTLLDEREALVGEVERLKSGIARAIDALEVEGQFVAAEIVREETDQALSSIKEKSCG